MSRGVLRDATPLVVFVFSLGCGPPTESGARWPESSNLSVPPQGEPPTELDRVAVPEWMHGWFKTLRCTVDLRPAPQVRHVFIGPTEARFLAEDGVLDEMQADWEVSSDPGLTMMSARIPIATAVWMHDGFVAVPADAHQGDKNVVTLYDRLTVNAEPTSLWDREIMFSMAQAEGRGAHSISHHLHCLAIRSSLVSWDADFEQLVRNAKSAERCELAAQCCRAERERGTVLGADVPQDLCAGAADFTPHDCTVWVAALANEYTEWEQARRCALAGGPRAEGCRQRFNKFRPDPKNDRISLLSIKVPKRPYELPDACVAAYDKQALPKVAALRPEP